MRRRVEATRRAQDGRAVAREVEADDALLEAPPDHPHLAGHGIDGLGEARVLPLELGKQAVALERPLGWVEAGEQERHLGAREAPEARAVRVDQVEVLLR